VFACVVGTICGCVCVKISYVCFERRVKKLFGMFVWGYYLCGGIVCVGILYMWGIVCLNGGREGEEG